jgi:lysozyme family protein
LQASEIPSKEWPKDAALMNAVNSWYFNKYWLPAQLDYFPQEIQLSCFGCVVNQGLSGFAKMLQRALVRVGASIVVDGTLGPITIEAVNHAPLGWLEDAFKVERFKDYLADANADPATQAQFLRGWDNRLEMGD